MPDTSTFAESLSPTEVQSILEPETSEDPTNILTTDEERAVAARILPALADKANKLAEANAAKKVEKVINEIRASNDAMIKTKIEEITKQSKPLEPDEIQKLVSQEYLEIKVQIREGRTKRTREFTLGELPQALEQKILTKLTKSIVPHLKELSAVDWVASATMADKIQKIVEMLPGTLDLMADIAAIALDPYEEEKIDAHWVSENMSSKRIADVIEGQVAVGRFRDFFSAVSRLFPQ